MKEKSRMRIESKVVGRYLVVKVLEPRLGADRAVNFKEAMWKFVDQGQKSLVLDLSSVEFIDSTGLGAILSVLKRMGTDGELLVSGASDAVDSMFKLTRMNRIFRMFSTVDDAISAPV
jgi:anti-sigma B factor antagonist